MTIFPTDAADTVITGFTDIVTANMAVVLTVTLFKDQGTSGMS